MVEEDKWIDKGDDCYKRRDKGDKTRIEKDKWESLDRCKRKERWGNIMHCIRKYKIR